MRKLNCQLIFGSIGGKVNIMKQAFSKTLNTFSIAIPIMAGVLLLISLINPLFQKFYPQLFTGNYFIDPLVGAIAGSISFGIPIISYITGGELLKSGVSLIAVTAFLLSWTTVGVMMLPLEVSALGKRFAIIRNSVNFVLAIVIAILTVVTLRLFQ